MKRDTTIKFLKMNATEYSKERLSFLKLKLLFLHKQLSSTYSKESIKKEFKERKEKLSVWIARFLHQDEIIQEDVELLMKFVNELIEEYEFFLSL